MADLPHIIVDPANNVGLFWGEGAPPSTFLPGKSSGWFNELTGDVYTLNGSSAWVQLGTGGGATSFGALTGIPTTVAGYGITDVYTKSASDARYQAAGSYQAPATTLAGYGITDAYTKTAADARYLQLSGGTLTAGLSGTTATFSGTFHAGGAATFASTLDVTGALSGASASIGGYPAALVRTGAYTSVPGDLAAGQIYFGY